MNRRVEADMTLMRIFISEGDRYENKPLYEALIDLCKAEGIAGATVLRGVMGYGVHGTMHTDKLLRLSSDLPLIVEVIDLPEKIDLLLPKLDGFITSGTVSVEKARVIRYGEE